MQPGSSARTGEDVGVLLSRVYSAEAAAYEVLWAPVLRELSVALLTQLPLAGAARVLDVGAGVGTALPEIEKAAPEALVMGVDRAPGMIARAPARFPRAVMDARRLALKGQTFDAVLMTFVLFFLEDPAAALREAARVLRPPGAIGVTTWGNSPSYAALDLFNEELDRIGAAPPETFAHHELVDHPGKLRTLLDGCGFASVRSWVEPFEHRQSLEGFIAHRTGHGTSKRRLDSLNDADRRLFIDRVVGLLSRLGDDDFVDRAEIVFAVARRRAEP